MTFHPGELEAQRLAGETEMARRSGKALGADVPPGAIRFLAEQPLLVHTTVDPAGRPWIGLALGRPGFVRAPDPREVTIDRGAARWLDPQLADHLRADPRIGLLAIEPATRRRLRINGRASSTPDGFAVAVEEAYPNCPKYIVRRQLLALEDRGPAEVRSGPGSPDPEDLARFARADTVFVGSVAPSGRADASHRGGERGFVRVEGGRLELPDYPGNGMFNTLGNFLLHPVGGLVVLDLRDSVLVQVVGEVEVRFDEPRRWSLRPTAWRRVELPVRAAWSG
jgi:uncharacterized protein